MESTPAQEAQTQEPQQRGRRRRRRPRTPLAAKDRYGLLRRYAQGAQRKDLALQYGLPGIGAVDRLLRAAVARSIGLAPPEAPLPPDLPLSA
jgi:hypothetical protein